MNTTDFNKELDELLQKYSILKNELIKSTVLNILAKYTDYELDDYVILEINDSNVETTETATQAELDKEMDQEMENILDETLDEIEIDDKNTQTCINTNDVSTSFNSHCMCDLCKNKSYNSIMSDIDKTFHDISYGIDEIGNFIGKWFDDIVNYEID